MRAHDAVILALVFAGIVTIAIFPTALLVRMWIFTANSATFGWYGRRKERVQGRAPIVMASTDFQARFFANGRPEDTCRHQGAVPVETLDGETVAALCPDCGKQLGAEWIPTAPEDYRNIEAEHEADHHGYWSVFLLACRLCAEECNPHLAAQPFTPDPRLTQRTKE